MVKVSSTTSAVALVLTKEKKRKGETEYPKFGGNVTQESAVILGKLGHVLSTM